MFESFEFETLTAPQAAIWFGLALGLLFGALAERTRFCLRRALVGEDRRAAAGTWLAALAVALAGTQALVGVGLVDFTDHRLLTQDIPLVMILLGGALFGGGMVLTRGCVSRLTVLGASGNLRAVLVLVVFAVMAHATLKGVLAPLRTGLAEATVEVPFALTELPGLGYGFAVVAAALALRAAPGLGQLIGGALIGALVPLGWVGTGHVLYDDFDPIALESLSFTAPYADALFWTIASSAIPANFGVGLVGGTLLGALIMAVVFGRFRWQSFESPAQTGRYLAGAVMMGLGGVLAGGCTMGAGLAGLPTLGLSAVPAMGGIIAGALAMQAVLRGDGSRMLQPAE